VGLCADLEFGGLQIGWKRIQAPAPKERQELLRDNANTLSFPAEGVRHHRTFETADFVEETANDSKMSTEDEPAASSSPQHDSTMDTSEENDAEPAKEKKEDKYWGDFARSYSLPPGKPQSLTSRFFVQNVGSVAQPKTQEPN
jgi:hypothetical protein